MRHPDYLTAALPGTGGTFKASPEDFLVEELPAYLPQGEGEHSFVWLEKRGLTTSEATRALARHLDLRESDIGVAGLKDKQAVTRQWLSLPRVDLERLRDLKLSVGAGALQVLRAERHRNKLRTGHLRGNRFTLTLRGVPGGAAQGAARAAAVLAALAASGVPNRYGAQRFGAGARNEEDGRRLVLGEAAGERPARRGGRDRQERRFLVSAYQSALFNRYLEARLREGLLGRVLAGDVLQKTDSGGIFSVADAEIAEAQGRVDSGAVVVTGPMFGSRMRAPTPGSASAAREEAVLRGEGLTLEEAQARFAALGALAEGTRRPLLVPIVNRGAAVEGAVEVGEEPMAAAHPDDPDAVVLRFSLPSGAYATVVLAEVMKPDPEEEPRSAAAEEPAELEA